MKMERKESVKRIGFYIGYVAFYFLFSTILFFILKLTERIEGKGEDYLFLLIAVLVALAIIKFIKKYVNK